jgi:hypothetical protein
MGRRFPSFAMGVCPQERATLDRLRVSRGALALGQVHQEGSSAPRRRRTGGKRLRALRLELGLTLRTVEQASVSLSQKLGNSEFLLPASRLHEFETRDVVPSIHRLYTLACIYEYEITDLLAWYGIPRRRTSRVRVPVTVKF